MLRPVKCQDELLACGSSIIHRATLPWSGKAVTSAATVSCRALCRKEDADFAGHGPLLLMDIVGGPAGGTLKVTFRRLQADCVLVHSECVLYLILSGWKFLVVEPDRKSCVNGGDRLVWAAKATV